MSDMQEKYDVLSKALEKIIAFELPEYKDIPDIGLYMEQVLDYVNGVFEAFSTIQDTALTSYMVNNYVKARVISEPEKKRYTRDHIGYLLAITSLKRSLTMSEIALLIEMDTRVSKNKSLLYGFFRAMSDDITKDVTKTLYGRASRFKTTYDGEKQRGDKDADINLRDRLGMLALRMSIQAATYKTLSSLLLKLIADDLHGDGVFTGGFSRDDQRKQSTEAKRLADSKARAMRELRKQERLAKKEGKKEE